MLMLPEFKNSVRDCLDSLQRVRRACDGAMPILVIDHENTDPEGVALITARRRQRGVDVLLYSGPFNWSAMSNQAVTGACMATRRTTFMTPKGFGPEVCLHHFESKTRGYLFGDAGHDAHKADLAHIVGKWSDFLRDPFHNPNVSPPGRPFTRLRAF